MSAAPSSLDDGLGFQPIGSQHAAAGDDLGFQPLQSSAKTAPKRAGLLQTPQVSRAAGVLPGETVNLETGDISGAPGAEVPHTVESKESITPEGKFARVALGTPGQPTVTGQQVMESVRPLMEPSHSETTGKPLARIGKNGAVEMPKEQPDVSQERATALPMVNLGEVTKIPVLHAAAEFAGSMTAPENVGMAATGPLVGAAAEAGPEIGAATEALSRLTGLYFSARMLGSAMRQSPKLEQQIKAGDWGNAADTLTQLGLTTAMAATSGAHAIDSESPATFGTLDRSKAAAPVDVESEARDEAGRQAAIADFDQQVNRLNERPALPTRSAAGEPPRSVRGPSGEPIATPPPVHSPEGATIAPGLTIDEMAARMLPAETGAPEEFGFLAGRPSPTPRLATVPTHGVIEDRELGFRPTVRPREESAAQAQLETHPAASKLKATPIEPTVAGISPIERAEATPHQQQHAKFMPGLEHETIMDPEEAAGLSAADLDRLLHDESGAASPEALADLLSGRLGKEAWSHFVASPIVRSLGLGDKYEAVKQADPAIADKLHLLDNAATYFRQKGELAVRNILGNLSRQQERLFVLMADADSRENLKTNHPAEYRQAVNDPAIRAALAKYRPIEQELTAQRERMGGTTLPGDYLRRVYEDHVAGIGKEQAPGQAPAAVPFERVVPQRVPGLSREASAEFHYQHGLHELGPAFGTKYVGTQLAALRDSIARDFVSKATEIAAGSPMPRTIDYEGKTYYRPDIAAEMKRGTPTYHVYDPTEGLKFPSKAESGKRYLGPAAIVDELRNYGSERPSTAGGLNRFLQEQVIGFGFGLPHVANILRRVTQAEPGAALNPRAWADAWRVMFDRELRTRGVKGLDDPTFDNLAKHGAITPGEMQELKKYWGGNLNPANWARSMAQMGHRLLFEPGTFGGLGGIDQRARIWVADLVKAQQPQLSDSEIADAVNTQLGNYNRRNWTETQKRVAPFMLFPGWSLSSMRWVIEHPIKTTVPPAVLVLLANQALQRLGVQKQPEDAWDISNVHVGNRSIGVDLLRESMARNLLRPAINYAQSKILGESDPNAVRSAVSGLESGAGGVADTLNPVITGGIALATNRKDVFNRQDLIQPQDWNTPGVVLPNKALDSLAALVVRHAIPSLDRILEPGEPFDFASFAGGNLGLPNYRYGAEQRLKKNAAAASEDYSQVSKLARTSPQKARQFVADPENAAYLLFHSELEHMATTLKRMNAAQATVNAASDLTAKQKTEALKNIAVARQNLLRNADGLDRLIFERIHGGPKHPAAAATR